MKQSTSSQAILNKLHVFWLPYLNSFEIQAALIHSSIPDRCARLNTDLSDDRACLSWRRSGDHSADRSKARRRPLRTLPCPPLWTFPSCAMVIYATSRALPMQAILFMQGNIHPGQLTTTCSAVRKRALAPSLFPLIPRRRRTRLDNSKWHHDELYFNEMYMDYRVHNCHPVLGISMASWWAHRAVTFPIGGIAPTAETVGCILSWLWLI